VGTSRNDPAGQLFQAPDGSLPVDPHPGDAQDTGASRGRRGAAACGQAERELEAPGARTLRARVPARVLAHAHAAAIHDSHPGRSAGPAPLVRHPAAGLGFLGQAPGPRVPGQGHPSGRSCLGARACARGGCLELPLHHPETGGERLLARDALVRAHAHAHLRELVRGLRACARGPLRHHRRALPHGADRGSHDGRGLARRALVPDRQRTRIRQSRRPYDAARFTRLRSIPGGPRRVSSRT